MNVDLVPSTVLPDEIINQEWILINYQMFSATQTSSSLIIHLLWQMGLCLVQSQVAVDDLITNTSNLSDCLYQLVHIVCSIWDY